MKTIVLDIFNNVDFLKEQKVYNSIVRYSFNRFQEQVEFKDIYQDCISKFSVGSYFINCAIRDAKSLYSKFENKHIIFGGKYNLISYLRGNKSKEQYQLDKLRPIILEGEACKKGNRYFNFHFEDDYVTYKKSRNEHYDIYFKNISKKYKKELLKIQELANQKKLTVTVKLDSTKQKLSIVYDESSLSECHYKDLKEKRIIGIDLNPNYIGLSILEFDKYDSEKFEVLHKRVFDLTNLTKKEISKNKRHHELIHICHQIDKLVNVLKCNRICIEDLCIESRDNCRGRNLNRLCNNVWNRNLVVNKLKMLANMHGYFLTEINPAYSSFIGNMLYGDETTPDMIAASIEIARRAYNKFNKGHFYPKFSIEALDEQWKQTLSRAEDWKEAFYKIKELGTMYRFQLSDCIRNAVFRISYKKKKISIYKFA